MWDRKSVPWWSWHLVALVVLLAIWRELRKMQRSA